MVTPFDEPLVKKSSSIMQDPGRQPSHAPGRNSLAAVGVLASRQGRLMKHGSADSLRHTEKTDINLDLQSG